MRRSVVDMKKEQLYKQALDEWGYAPQVRMAIEECAELIKALAKIQRNTNYLTIDDVLEEMADVEIMLEQLKIIFDYEVSGLLSISKFQRIKENKLKRLEKLIDD